MLRRITLIVVCLLAIAWPARAEVPATPRVENVLPRDTQAVIIVRDLPALVKKLETHPWGKSLADEQVRRFFGPLLRVIKENYYIVPAWEQEMGMTWREALGKFPGQVAFAWDFRALIPPNPKNEIPSAASTVFIADIGDNADVIRKLIGKPAAPADPNSDFHVGNTTEQFEGVTLTLSYFKIEGRRTDTGGWAIVGRQMVSASSTPTLQRTVHELLHPSGPGTHLADAPAFQRLRELRAAELARRLQCGADVRTGDTITSKSTTLERDPEAMTQPTDTPDVQSHELWAANLGYDVVRIPRIRCPKCRAIAMGRPQHSDRDGDVSIQRRRCVACGTIYVVLVQ